MNRWLRQSGTQLCDVLGQKLNVRFFYRRVIPRIVKETGSELPLGASRVRNFRASRMVASQKKDHYEVLGVSRSATKADIKKAYYALAKKFHPDTNKGDKNLESKFAEINVAYEVLSDDEKRKAYDSFGHDAENMSGGFPGGGFPGGFPGGFGGGGFPEDLQDLLNGMFGGGGGGGGRRARRRSGPMKERGEDVQVSLPITFMEAAFGCTKTVQLALDASCKKCSGSGHQPGTTSQTCGTCNGQGVLNRQMGGMFMQTTCPGCDGMGESHTNCSGCGGRGLVKERKTVNVTIPPGVDGRTVLELRGQGNAGRSSGPMGTLYVQLSVGSHPVFTREGLDVVVTVPLPFTTAALGGKVKVPTLNGETVVSVPSGTQTDDKQSLRGAGIRNPQNPSMIGQQIIKFRVAVPRSLSNRQRELLLELARESGDVNVEQSTRPTPSPPPPPPSSSSPSSSSSNPSSSSTSSSSSSTSETGEAGKGNGFFGKVKNLLCDDKKKKDDDK